MSFDQTVTSTKFSKAVGTYMEKSAKAPVLITKHDRPARVLIDIDEYERLKKHDTRTAYRVSEMTDEHAKMIGEGEYGEVDPALEKLMD